ncbi:MAG: hypothetical protein LC632_05285 [Xanthomonadaceae bacterium]|nr:hypothetical protein [Xanthomonadaceae bacterium]
MTIATANVGLTASAVSFGAAVAGQFGAESLTVVGNTTLGANILFSNLANLTLDGTVDGDVAGRTLTIDITGALSITGAAGGTQNLGGFTVVGNATSVTVDAVTVSGAPILIGSAGNPIPVINANGTLTTLLAGAGGTLILQGGGITLAGIAVGQHNIELYGDGQDTVVANPITSAGAITISAPRDVVVEALITTTAGDITLTADSDNNGTGGVLITATGGLNSAGAVVVNGTAFTDLNALGGYRGRRRGRHQ